MQLKDKPTYEEVRVSMEYLTFTELRFLRKRLDAMIQGREEIADALKNNLKKIKDKHGR